ncbi:hypothetical protein [Campylobacter gracilis]|uniref:Tetratricopeptide repeat protein n=1 Tax=Campylobacter gracilis RM3268 TaxID=553220 RepID=C8PI82_9BACT|nr:hypothetical protein [Campylobacter gracilis]AKT91583.1 hypothetical protein CGRAC_0112 [Campylobacter gracilis]EEV17472.1 hypothetical protein CAMGR0001_0063 [Campylobacter gracilis RM3268]UEB46206.1 hypothetical protein LK410_03675 [Campylobacter gracilis]SUW77970.1 Uncharacterised protein [Campylobacter gracilis]
MEQGSLEGLYEKLNGLKSVIDKEECLFDAIRDAVEAENFEFAAQICDFVLNDDFEKFGAVLRTRALLWLTNHIAQNLKESEYPNFGDFTDCLWKFKWIVSGVAKSSMIEKELIDETNEAMLFYYERLELSPASYYKALMNQNIVMGDARGAKANYELWKKLAKDDMSDCEACEASDEIAYLNFAGEHAAALELAAPILSGELTCGEVPHTTYAPILFSMIALGRTWEAKALLPKAAATIESNPRVINQIAPLIEIAVRLDERETALSLARKHSAAILDGNDDLNDLRFFIAVSAFGDEGDYKTALELTGKFDARNQNFYYADYLNKFYEEFGV